MRLALAYLEQQHVSRATLSGVMRLLEYQAMVRAVLAEMSARRTTRIVLDLRDVAFNLSFAETSGLPDLNLKLGVPLHYRVAMVYLDYSAKAAGVRLYEVIAVNRGFYAQKLFARYSDAIEWLAPSLEGYARSDRSEGNLALHGARGKPPVVSDQENGRFIGGCHLQQ